MLGAPKVFISSTVADLKEYRDKAKAAAIRAGSSARVTADATSTPLQPSSMARQASDAVPIPASRMTGTPDCSTMSSMLCGFRMPSPLPMGAPSGMTAAQPTCSRRWATTVPDR